MQLKTDRMSQWPSLRPIREPQTQLMQHFNHTFTDEYRQQLLELQAQGPVTYDAELDMWLISSHQDVRAAFLDHETFKPSNTLDAVTQPAFSTLRKLARSGFRLPKTLANNATPSHPDLRRLTTRFIGPAAASAAVPMISEVVDDAMKSTVEILNTHGNCDLVETIARPVPLRVIVSLVGVAPPDFQRFTNWSKSTLELFWGVPSAHRQQLLANEVNEFYGWLNECFDSSTVEDGSMFGALRNAKIEGGRRLTRDEIIGACFFTLIAGQETTTQLLATAFHYLLNDTSRWRVLEESPDTVAGLVDELLRLEPPINTWRRVATRDVEVKGTPIPKGANVLLMLAAAGMDSNVFDDSVNVCPHRVNSREHLAFGAGRHRCPGAELARIEATLCLRAAMKALPSVQLSEKQPPMAALLSFRSPGRVLVELN